MKKTIFKGSIFILLLLCAGLLISLRVRALPEEEEEPVELEELLSYSPWTDSEGRSLSFEENSEGELEGRAFSWEEVSGELILSFKPESPISARQSFSLLNEEGRLKISLGGAEFTQSAFKAPVREKSVPPKEPEPEPGQELADFAAALVGSKYLYGGKSPETGFDCSGLAVYVYDNFGYSLSRIASDQAKQGVHVEPDELQPGDLLCFYSSGSYIGHVGIYLGGGLYVHAMGSAYGVRTDSLDDPYLTRKFEARRILGCGELMKNPPSRHVPLSPEQRWETLIN